MEVMRDYPDNAFDLAIVDPPYGIKMGGGTIGGVAKKNKLLSSPIPPSNFYPTAGGDKETPTQEYFDELKRVSKNQIIWGGNHMIDKIKNPSPCWLVWDKKTGKNKFSDCELAFTSFKTTIRKFSFLWSGCLQADRTTREKRIHPNQKPIQLYKWILENYTQDGDSILDTHLGSGSSAIAAHYYNREFVGIELSEHYYNAALTRFDNLTKQKSFL